MKSQAHDPLQSWLADAIADARRRGLPDLEPLLESLRRQLETLRAADWNDDAGGGLRPEPRGGRGRR